MRTSHRLRDRIFREIFSLFADGRRESPRSTIAAVYGREVSMDRVSKEDDHGVSTVVDVVVVVV